MCASSRTVIHVYLEYCFYRCQEGWCQIIFQRHFTKGDFPSDKFPSGNFPNVKFSKRQLFKGQVGPLRRRRLEYCLQELGGISMYNRNTVCKNQEISMYAWNTVYRNQEGYPCIPGILSVRTRKNIHVYLEYCLQELGRISMYTWNTVCGNQEGYLCIPGFLSVGTMKDIYVYLESRLQELGRISMRLQRIVLKEGSM